MSAVSAPTPELRLWLGYVERRGALWEADGPDTFAVVLPPDLQRGLGLPEHTTVTASPEAAREEGSILLCAGHPLVDAAVAELLEAGDAGQRWVGWPRPPLPPADELLDAARSFLPVDHGRVDPAEPATPFYAPLLRVGCLVTYTVSDRYQEREEVWVCGRTGASVGRVDPEWLASSRLTADPVADPVLTRALRGAEAALESITARRLRELTSTAQPDLRREVERTRAYYLDALSRLTKRRAATTPDRLRLIDARIAATEWERDRRLQEIDDKFRADHTIRPFRLHLVHVPALLLQVSIRRGERRWPLALTWLLHAGTFIPIRCPACNADQPLVAGRDRLGCRQCLPRPPTAAPPDLQITGRVVGRSSPAAKPLDASTVPGGPPSERSGGGHPSTPATSPDDRARDHVIPLGAAARAGGAVRASLPPGVDTRRPKTRAGAGRFGPGRQPLGSDARARDLGLSPSLERELTRSRATLERRRKQMAKAGDRLAFDLWQAAASGCLLPARQVSPGSPFEVLQRLYGAAASLVAIGAPVSHRPESSTSMSDWDPLLETGMSGGYISARGQKHPFAIGWRWEGERARVTVLEPPGLGRGDKPASSAAVPVSGMTRLYWNAPRPTATLDAVEAAMWECDIGNAGLSQVVRCMAIWGLLRTAPPPAPAGGEAAAPPGRRQGGWEALPPRVSAAAVALAVSRARGLRRTQGAICRAYGVEAATVAPLARAVVRILERGRRQ